MDLQLFLLFEKVITITYNVVDPDPGLRHDVVFIGHIANRLIRKKGRDKICTHTLRIEVFF
jgi:hypothetical protein